MLAQIWIHGDSLILTCTSSAQSRVLATRALSYRGRWFDERLKDANTTALVSPETGRRDVLHLAYEAWNRPPWRTRISLFASAYSCRDSLDVPHRDYLTRRDTASWPSRIKSAMKLLQ